MGLPNRIFTRAYRRRSKPHWAKLLEEALGILVLHIWIMCEIISNFKNIFTPSPVLGVRTDFFDACLWTVDESVVETRGGGGHDFNFSVMWGACCPDMIETGYMNSWGPDQTNIDLCSPWFSGVITPSRLFDVWKTQITLLKHGSDSILGARMGGNRFSWKVCAMIQYIVQ